MAWPMCWGWPINGQHLRVLEIDGDALLFPIAIAHRLGAVAPAQLGRQIKRRLFATRFGLGQSALRRRRQVRLFGIGHARGSFRRGP